MRIYHKLVKWRIIALHITTLRIIIEYLMRVANIPFLNYDQQKDSYVCHGYESLENGKLIQIISQQKKE